MRKGKYVVTVDGGTTKTRLCVWDLQGNILKTVMYHVGARDSALHSGSKIWKDTVRNMIREAAEKLGLENDEISLVTISGMLTSNLGIYEVPHLEAPVTLKELAEKAAIIYDEELIQSKILLITGIKNNTSLLNEASRVKEFDVMRGEETEVFAISEEIGNQKNTIYVLPGSHNKFVYVDAKGTILGCKTTLSGELLNSVTNDTILSASLDKRFLEEENYSEELVLKGYYTAKDEGENRALCFIRILDLFCGWTAQQLQNYALGAVLKSDIEALHKGEFFDRDENPRIVVVGNSVLCQGFYSILKKERADMEILFFKNEERPFAAEGAYLIAKKILLNLQE